MIRYKMVAFVLQITFLGGVIGLCVGYIWKGMLGINVGAPYVTLGMVRGITFGFILGIIAFIVEVIARKTEFHENIRLRDKMDSLEKTS